MRTALRWLLRWGGWLCGDTGRERECAYNESTFCRRRVEGMVLTHPMVCTASVMANISALV